MTSDPIDLYANLNLNEIKAEFIQEKELIVEDTPELKELKEKFDVLAEYEAWDKALVCIDKVLKINQNNPSALFNKGTVLMHLKQWEEALECFGETKNEGEDMYLMYVNIGFCYIEMLMEMPRDETGELQINADNIETIVEYVLQIERSLAKLVELFEQNPNSTHLLMAGHFLQILIRVCCLKFSFYNKQEMWELSDSVERTIKQHQLLHHALIRSLKKSTELPEWEKIRETEFGKLTVQEIDANVNLQEWAQKFFSHLIKEKAEIRNDK